MKLPVVHAGIGVLLALALAGGTVLNSQADEQKPNKNADCCGKSAESDAKKNLLPAVCTCPQFQYATDDTETICYWYCERCGLSEFTSRAYTCGNEPEPTACGEPCNLEYCEELFRFKDGKQKYQKPGKTKKKKDKQPKGKAQGQMTIENSWFVKFVDPKQQKESGRQKESEGTVYARVFLVKVKGQRGPDGNMKPDTLLTLGWEIEEEVTPDFEVTKVMPHPALSHIYHLQIGALPVEVVTDGMAR
jgi:hypothetical protein